MNISKKEYPKYADAHAPKSDLLRDTMRAFLIGGLICAVAQGLTTLWKSLGMVKEDAGLLTSVILVFASALLTALGIFDNIAKVAGGGTLVPITGFANSVVSAAIDSKNEGFILGLGSGIFTVAGPVLLYGTAAGTLYGVIYWIFSLF
ncbi:MAG: SpoVA/SpoVAEb family sporulation membrane protein [Clostridia bacterium]|nr:SpoVA/SpoVAEb family sporulation membrane protein [Clostridia bacterium]